VRSFQHAIELDPTYYNALINLSNAYCLAGAVAEATIILERAETCPSARRAEVYLCRARVLHASGEPIGALRWLRKAATHGATGFDIYLQRAYIYFARNWFRSAVASAKLASRLRPDNPDAWYVLACAALKCRSMQDAVPAFKRVMRLRPGDINAPIGLVHCGLRRPTCVAPRSYVTALFDGYADRFDNHLVKDLQYTLPEVVARRAVDDASRQWSTLAVLDAGCGTGLVATHFPSRPRFLLGVDLSARMLEKARARCLYHELSQREVLEYLEATGPAFDVIVFCDVLVYVGDLRPILRACRARLTSGGVVVASTELLGRGKSFALTKTGRFSHPLCYVERAAHEAGLDLKGKAIIDGRMEGERLVPCLVVTLSRLGRL
jgi:predicted TPR repeat methyltransferase